MPWGRRLKVESGGRATARGGEGHNLVVGEGIGEVVEEKGEGVVARRMGLRGGGSSRRHRGAKGRQNAGR